MRNILLFSFSCLLVVTAQCQLPEAMNMPDFIKPTPEVSALLKADNLSINFATGSPNISIPIHSIGLNGIEVPITLSYNSTGVKVDEYSSMVGTGWTCSYGGVISRTVFDKGDEDRNIYTPSNLSPLNFGSPDAALLNFLQNHTDAESDIFSFSFLNYSGKFILDSTKMNIIPLSNYNVVIKLLTNDFQHGFEITTEDGTTYRFEDAEASKSRTPLGSNCPKNVNSINRKTSWYLTKITTPNKRSYIKFNYTASDITYEQSITQYISKCIATDYYPGACGGAACTLYGETFYTCITRQLVTNQFISSIVTSSGDSASFIYDTSPREDLDGGKRLSQIQIINRNGLLIKQVTLYGSYPAGIGSSAYSSADKRLFLDSIKINDVTDSTNTLAYTFDYFDKSLVATRLCLLQDLYGYNNGKSGNASLLPILSPTDPNYSNFNSGMGGTLVDFGDRSIDTTYAMYGLLKKITYPTGGYDSLIYIPNKVYKDSLILAGGSSISAIQSYSFGQKVLEKSYSYLNPNGYPSTFLLTDNIHFSDQISVLKDGYNCGSVTYCEGPSCTFASVSSNLNNPITNLEGQHAYHRRVIEKISGSTDNGYSEHHFIYFGGGNISPTDVMGNRIMAAPFQVVHDFLIGEDTTNIYRYDTATAGYKLQKRTLKYYHFGDFDTYYSYPIKKNFTSALTTTPPSSCEFDPYDVAKYAINVYNIFNDSTKEVTYDNNNDSFLVKTTTEHASSLHSYPTKQIIYTPDGDTLETRRTYPLDGSSSVMTYRNIVSPVLEEKNYKNNTLLSTITHTYNDWFSDSSVVALQQTEYKEQTNSMPVHINYLDYDTLGNVLEIAKDSGVYKSYLWGYNKQLPIAVATNAADNEIFYTSFEETDGTSDAQAKTGGKSHSGNYTVSFSLPNGKSYVLTYWNWDGTKWVYYETAYTGSTTITTSYKIDEVRIFPSDAQVVTFTYEPMLGITSQCDARNMVSYYEYDALNRLKLIRDEDGKILKLFDYKYQQ